MELMNSSNAVETHVHDMSSCGSFVRTTVKKCSHSPSHTPVLEHWISTLKLVLKGNAISYWEHLMETLIEYTASAKSSSPQWHWWCHMIDLCYGSDLFMMMIQTEHLLSRHELTITPFLLQQFLTLVTNCCTLEITRCISQISVPTIGKVNNSLSPICRLYCTYI